MLTGGAVTKMLARLESQPFFGITSDIVWWESAESLLKKTNAWNPKEMDALLAAVRKPNTFGYYGGGHYDLKAGNSLKNGVWLRLRLCSDCYYVPANFPRIKNLAQVQYNPNYNVTLRNRTARQIKPCGTWKEFGQIYAARKDSQKQEQRCFWRSRKLHCAVNYNIILVVKS